MPPPTGPERNGLAAARPTAGTATALAFRWLPVILWMGLIFFLSSQPSLPKAPDDWLDVLTKKCAHFGEYFVLALLMNRALGAGGAINGRALVGFVIAVAYAISDELHQQFVPGRTPSLWDVAIDALGAIAGVMLFARWRRYTLKRTLITSPSRTT